MQLRDYQSDLIDRVRRSIIKHKRTICQAPTGAGKTVLATYMLGEAAKKGNRCFFVVHRHELLIQTCQALEEQGIDYETVVAGKRNFLGKQIKVASIQTLIKRLDVLSPPDLIIIDEAHRAKAKTYQDIIQAWNSAFIVGLTATPERTDGDGLNDTFNDLVLGPEVYQLQEKGYLAHHRIFAPGTVDMTNVRTKQGDYDPYETEGKVNSRVIIGDAIDHYKKIASGRRAIVFCVTRKHGYNVAHMFQKAGIPAECITGETGKVNRRKGMERFRKGETLVLVTVDLVIEGLDVPDAEAAILLRPTQSLIVHQQTMGRVLRPKTNGNEAVILDHVGNTYKHGQPDEIINWSLQGKDKRKQKTKESEDEGKKCPNCKTLNKEDADTCRACGYSFKKNKEPAQMDGELIEIKKQKRREVGKAQTIEDLIKLGIKRQYSNPSGWASFVIAKRESREPSINEFKENKNIYRRIIQKEQIETSTST